MYFFLNQGPKKGYLVRFHATNYKTQSWCKLIVHTIIIAQFIKTTIVTSINLTQPWIKLLTGQSSKIFKIN